MEKEKNSTEKSAAHTVIAKNNDKRGNRTKFIKGAALAVVLITGLLLWQYLGYQNKIQAKREAQQKQEALLVQHWTEQGLSEEAIQTKLRETRQEAFDPDDAPLMFQILRTVRHATGTGPGAGGQSSGMVLPELGTGTRDGSGGGMGMGGGSR